MALAIISFDAVSSDDIEYLSTLENFSTLMRRGTLVTQAESVFLTNTYPVHSSVITGVHPFKHGVYENTFPDAFKKRLSWRCYRDSITATTLYDEALKAGIDACAILWPVSGGARIRKNLPEVVAREGENQMLAILRAGSRRFMISCLLRYGRHLRGISQPGLDDFAVRCAAGAGRGFELLLLHLTDVDSHKHRYGPDSAEARAAIERADKRLGMLMHVYKDWDFIVFGDHGCKSTIGSVDLNEFWNDPHSHWHPAGGCALLKLRDGLGARAPSIDALTADPRCRIKRVLSDDEMVISGLDREFALGVEAEDGYCFAVGEYKGNHGYSLATDSYKVFYLAAGRNIYENKLITGGSVLDIAPLGARLLGLPLWDMDGKLDTEVYYG